MPVKREFVRDFVLADCTPEDIGELVIGHLTAKGFCLVDAGLSPDVLEKAVSSDAADIDRAQKLRRPPAEIVEGLLGEEGSSRITYLELEDLEEGAQRALEATDWATNVGSSLKAVDQVMWDMGGHVVPWLPLLGFEAGCRRSAAVLHETGMPEGAPPKLREAEAAEWLYLFNRGFLMMIAALGPGTGTLQLTPYDEEAEAMDIEMPPGSFALVRSDMIACKHTCRGKALVLTCSIMDGRTFDEKRSSLPPSTPCAKALNDWVNNRLGELKDMEEEDLKLNVPREWLQAMNKQCFKGQHMAVRGIAMRMPIAWSEDVWYAAAFQGVDYMVDVPITRWRHSERFSPEPDGWKENQTHARHFGVVDGCELFDNKMFSLTPAECKVMDPQQRIVLENGYEALLKSGYKKGQIMNSTGGMYLGFGTGSSDFNFLERDRDSGAEGSFGATGGSAAIASNRFNFCLGMRGPSISIDSEDASGMVAVHLGCEGLQKRGRLTTNFFSLVGGIKINLAPYWWPQKQAMGLMSPSRSKTFDNSADGFVMGDNATNLCLNALTDVVDGQVIMKEYNEMVGTVAGSCVNHNGRSATFNAPCGPAEQEVISTCLRAAGLSGFDIDSSEMYGAGTFLADAIEVSSAVRILRLAEDFKEPINLTAVKTMNGNMSWAAGAAAFVRAIVCNSWGAMAPNLHLHQLNPHIDEDTPTCFGTELNEFQLTSSHVGAMARGFGGINAYAVAFGHMDDQKVKPWNFAPKEQTRERLTFWPGGGGELDAEATPRRGFHIAGTFTQWEPESMEMESTGVYAYDVTLSHNRWEQFQIWLDGDPLKCLYPEEHKAGKLTSVEGPSPISGGNAWHIEGRTTQDALTAGAAEVGTVDRGWIGAKYSVRLHVAGKYRMVDWERVSGMAEDAQLAIATEAAEALPRSSYFISADWNCWGYERMVEGQADDAKSVLSTFEVRLLREGGEFQILRNKDFKQVIYPTEAMAGPSDDPAGIGGPDEDDDSQAWYLDGTPGDTFLIEFRRSIERGIDVKRVTWQLKGNTPLNEDERILAQKAVFSTFGSWDGGVRLRGLRWNGSYHYFLVELGADGEAKFQLAQDYDWDRLFFPSVADAGLEEKYDVLGPAPGGGRSRGLNWKIGGQGKSPGDVFEVRVHDKVRYYGTGIYKVEWQRVSPGPKLDSAYASGHVLSARIGSGK